MKLNEIKNIYESSLYERFMEDEDFLDEGAKELFAAGKKKLGAAAEKLKDAADAPAQKAWAEIQSRLATAGKDDAIGKLKAFASKNKVAIGTLAILGAGMLFSGDASASDAMQAGADMAGGFAGQAADAAGGGGDAILNNLVQQVQNQGMDAQKFMQAMSNVQVDGMGVQDFADQLSKQPDNVQQNGISKIIKATLQASQQGAEQVADAGTQGQDAGGNFTTTTKEFTRQNMDPAMAQKLRGG